MQKTREIAVEAADLYSKIAYHRAKLKALSAIVDNPHVAMGIQIERADEGALDDEDFGILYHWSSERGSAEVVFRRMTQWLAGDHMAKLQAAEQRLRELGFAPEAEA